MTTRLEPAPPSLSEIPPLGSPGAFEDGRRRPVILSLRPEVSGGRYPVKRALGESVDVCADILSDGHEVLRAVLLYRHRSEEALREVPMTPAGNDSFLASFSPDKLGRYTFVAEAWIDTFATFVHDLSRKHAAAQDVSLELLHGAILIEEAAARAAQRQNPTDSELLREAAAELRSDVPTDLRVALARSNAVAKRMAQYPDRRLASRSPERAVNVERKLARASAWYELFPRSTGRGGQHGTFKDVEDRLSYVAEMGFDILYLPPIHPIGQAFRKGPNNSPVSGPNDPGSPWAVGAKEGGHTAVHPELGTLSDFRRLVVRARTMSIEVALDIAFQASPDHPWVKEHPEWFKKRADGSIQYAENPPKKYQDVYPFDFECDDWRGLWEALRGVFIFWIEQGVRIFRVDNPHTKPLSFWEWTIRTVQDAYPDTVFLSEAFTRPKLMYALAKVGFSQSYTYFTWRTTAHDLKSYLTEISRPEVLDFFRPNFWPTTPDIFPEDLHHGSRPAFMIRLFLAATLSASYGIYGPSFELLDRVPRPDAEELCDNEKYQIREWNLEHPDSLRYVIAQLNRIRRENPAFACQGSLLFHASDNDFLLCYSKRSEDSSNVILVVVNLDPRHAHTGWMTLDLAALGLREDVTFQAHDLMSGDRYSLRGPRLYVELSPTVMPVHIFSLKKFVRTENNFEYFL